LGQAVYRSGDEVLQEFKAFILRGNMLDLAVAVVIGAAFGVVISSLVANIITPIIAIPGEAPDFSQLALTISDSRILYGQFINDVIAFVLVAAAVFFLVIKPVNALMARHRTEPDVTAPSKNCPECLSSIPEGARRCAFCTAEQTA
jgi:large conductance mechanosensitive channel